MKNWLALLFLTLAAAVPAGPARAAFIHTESINGDLSNNRLAPTVLTAMEGANVLTGSTVTIGVATDLDYFTVVVPAGLQLDSLFQTFYQGDGRSFIAVQAGTTFTLGPDDPMLPSGLLGWLHFGEEHVEQDILPRMAESFGATGYTTPLPSGSYTFWVQETSPIAALYTLTFNVSPAGGAVIPEPSSLCLAGVSVLTGLSYAGGRRWRRRREPVAAG